MRVYPLFCRLIRRGLMTDNLVTVARFSHPHESHVWRARLESEGISCFIADEHTVSAYWFYSNAVGGVKLQVRSTDAERAEQILDASHEEAARSLEELWSTLEASGPRPDDALAPAAATESTEGEPTRCPRCGSTEVFYEKFSRPMIFLSILLLGIPLPFLSRRWTCRSCELTWKMKLFR